MAPRKSARIQKKDAQKKECAKTQGTTNNTQSTNTKSRKTHRRRRRRSTPRQAQNGRNSTRETREALDAAPKPKPIVINLDVTYSEPSDYSDDSDVEEVPVSISSTPHNQNKKKKKAIQNLKSVTVDSNAHIKNNRCSLSDSEEDIMPDFCPLKSSLKRGLPSDSDSETEIYKVNYKEDRLKAFEEVENKIKSISSMGKPTSCDIIKKKKTEKPIIIDDEFFLKDDNNFNDSHLDSSLNSSLDLNIDISSVVLKGAASRGRRQNKKTKMALASIQAFTKKLQEDSEITCNDSYLDDDDIIIAEDSTIPVRVCWGTSYTRHILKKHVKFSEFYKEIAEKHQISVSQVVLSFKDSVVSPESCPRDIKLSIGDILEGGILQKNFNNSSNSESTTEEKAEGEILLKVQTSNRKIVHAVSMNKYDKMSVLMEKYSKLRGIPLTKLKFKFDGETLEPSDTPSSLDLEGEECIDVFEL